MPGLRIYMVAICGVGMAPLAILLKRAGHRVSGSDSAAYPPMSDALEAEGIAISAGYSVDNIPADTDLAIVGNAVPATNPEAEAVERLTVDRLSMPEAVARFLLDGKESLVVAGTHGKTTTTAMLARALQTAGLEPGYLVGGAVPELGELAGQARGPHFVIEGDEYDTAYFDKRPKFVHYQPSAAIVTSLEFDHADIYSDIGAIKYAFASLAELLPAGGALVGCGDWPELVDAVASTGQGRFIRYGLGADNDWRLAAHEQTEQGQTYLAAYRGRSEDLISLVVPGTMNALNALAVYALARELGVSRAAVVEGLAGFRGAVRRQEVIGETAGVTVIDDFAHHPTAVAATLAALRARYPGRKLRAVFEPRSNTSRRAVFQQRYAEALSAADSVVVSAVYAKDNDPLADDERLSTSDLVEQLESGGTKAWQADGPDEILERLTGKLRKGDVVVCMSNGAFGGLPRRLLEALAGG
ncbi:MAG: Mur ligase family protein [Deltaproteobacteria bacterium]